MVNFPHPFSPLKFSSVNLPRAVKFFLPLSLWLLGTSLFGNANPSADAGNLTERMVELVFQVGVIVFAAHLGGIWISKIKMPSVLGELLIGILIGPYLLGGVTFWGFPHGLFPLTGGAIPISPELYGLSIIASIILLFHSGLETDISLFLRFAVKGIIIGIGGIIVSFLVGMYVGYLITGDSFFAPVHLFLGVISTATSVGITARILSEHKKMDSPEGVTILAAAVIDDVVGIILFAIVLGISAIPQGGEGGGSLWLPVSKIAIKAVVVWLGFTAIGLLMAQKIGKFLQKFGSQTAIAVMGFGLALILAGIFEKAGLAMIIGAYVMGLSLSRTDLSFVIQEKIHPLQEFFVPIFFCVMGMLVNIREFFNAEVLLMGFIFSVLGVIAKVIGCGVPSLFLKFNLLGSARVGVGMIPRGEVALIIAGVGLSSGILNEQIFSVAIFMTLATTIIAPPLLEVLLRNPKSGTVGNLGKSTRIVTTFPFPNQMITKIAGSTIVEAFQDEKFYLYRMKGWDHAIYQIRKDEVFLTFHEYGDRIECVSLKEDAYYVKTVVYESLLELHRTIENLKNIAKPEELKRELVGEKDARIKGKIVEELNPRCISLSLQSESKQDLIKEMLTLLYKAGYVNDYDLCLEAINERESSMSTGMQSGIAIPHGRCNGVSQLVFAIGFHREGIDFQSMDKEVSKLFILSLSPLDASTEHLQFLATISTILGKPDILEELEKSSTVEEFKKILLRGASSKPPARPQAQNSKNPRDKG